MWGTANLSQADLTPGAGQTSPISRREREGGSEGPRGRFLHDMACSPGSDGVVLGARAPGAASSPASELHPRRLCGRGRVACSLLPGAAPSRVGSEE